MVVKERLVVIRDIQEMDVDEHGVGCVLNIRENTNINYKSSG